MNDPVYNLSKTAAGQMADVIRAFSPQTRSAAGDPGGNRRPLNAKFKAKITGNDGIPGPYYYAWQEMYDAGNGGDVPNLQPKPAPEGRSGTTAANFAVNRYDPATFPGIVPNNTIVEMVLDFGSDGVPVWRFDFDCGILEGTWVPTSNNAPDCAANLPTFSSVEIAATKQYWLKDDFSVGQQKAGGVPCNPGAVLYQNKYNTWIHSYASLGAPDQVASDTKVIRVIDEGRNGNFPPTTQTLVSPSATSNRYSVYFTVTPETEADPASNFAGYVRNGMQLQGDVFIDPASGGSSVSVANDGTSLGNFVVLNTGPGLVATLTGATAVLTWSGILAIDDDSDAIGTGTLTTGGGFTVIQTGNNLTGTAYGNILRLDVSGLTAGSAATFTPQVSNGGGGFTDWTTQSTTLAMYNLGTPLDWNTSGPISIAAALDRLAAFAKRVNDALTAAGVAGFPVTYP